MKFERKIEYKRYKSEESGYFGYSYIDITESWKEITGLIHVQKVIGVIDEFFQEDEFKLASNNRKFDKAITFDKTSIPSRICALKIFVNKTHKFEISSSEWLNVSKIQ